MIAKLKPSTLIRLGFGALALRGIFQLTIDRTMHATDATDFVSGLLMGISFSVLAIYAWLHGRSGRDRPTAGCG